MIFSTYREQIETIHMIYEGNEDYVNAFAIISKLSPVSRLLLTEKRSLMGSFFCLSFNAEDKKVSNQASNAKYKKINIKKIFFSLDAELMVEFFYDYDKSKDIGQQALTIQYQYPTYPQAVKNQHLAKTYFPHYFNSHESSNALLQRTFFIVNGTNKDILMNVSSINFGVMDELYSFTELIRQERIVARLDCFPIRAHERYIEYENYFEEKRLRDGRESCEFALSI